MAFTLGHPASESRKKPKTLSGIETTTELGLGPKGRLPEKT